MKRIYIDWRHPIEQFRWWKWQLLKKLICERWGHRQDHIDEIIGVCGRCYEPLPQSEEQHAIFRGAMQQAWDHAEANLTKDQGTGQ